MWTGLLARWLNICGYAIGFRFRDPRCGIGPISKDADPMPAADGHAATCTEYRSVFRDPRSRSRRIPASCQTVSREWVREPRALGLMAACPGASAPFSPGHDQDPAVRPGVVTLDPALQHLSRVVRALRGLFAGSQTAGCRHISGKCGAPPPPLARGWRGRVPALWHQPAGAQHEAALFADSPY